MSVGQGDEVILPANTYIATALAVSAAGARPVLVDVAEPNFAIDPERVDELAAYMLTLRNPAYKPAIQ